MLIGIDLGTTNSLVACFRNGKAEIIPNRLGENLTPSVVSVDDKGTVYVGRSAMDAPDIDTKTMFTAARELHAGDFVQVEILDSEGYDLIGCEYEELEAEDDE